ncbi:MAG: hypothetical protein HY782_15500 [Chloroflexi bacterium]|nr:hypothetical protein [Chloroflexota bacterium]
MAKKLQINRAPVLTLWATVVAERLGYKRAEALTLAKAVTGLNAQAKGQRLGIYQPRAETPEKQRKRKEAETFTVLLLGRPVSAVSTDEGIRATTKGRPIRAESVESYLQGKFGDDLEDTQKAMRELARAFKPSELAARAYALYEDFRPEIPEGTRGWGAKGILNLDHIRSLAKED